MVRIAELLPERYHGVYARDGINRKRFYPERKAHESAVVVRRLPFLRLLDSSGCSSSWSPQTSSMSAM